MGKSDLSRKIQGSPNFKTPPMKPKNVTAYKFVDSYKNHRMAVGGLQNFLEVLEVKCSIQICIMILLIKVYIFRQ